MDTETLKSLSSLLVWGGLFFLMMRYGCGAHVMGGHGHHGHRSRDVETDERDPVCGMTVQPNASPAAAVHRGRTYYFCSRSCRDKFEAGPQQYTTAGAPEGHHHA